VAIAFDAATDGGLDLAGPLTFAHTVSGSDRVLFVGVFGSTVFVDATGNDVTGVTYNGAAMTERTRQLEQGDGVNDRWCYLFSLVAPDTGTHNVVVGGSGVQGAIAASYTGVSSIGIGTSAAAGPSATSVTANVNVGTASSWTVAVIKENVGQAVTGTGTVSNRLSNNGIGLHYLDSNGTVATGLQAVGGSGSSAAWALIGTQLAPVASGGKPYYAYAQQ
jgi:hypothetical protein